MQCKHSLSIVVMMSMMDVKTYSELILLPTFEKRFEYLKLSGIVGQDTFGYDRYLNQYLYHVDRDWKRARDRAIIRDNGCDLAMDGYIIYDRILVHHINPITVDDIKLRRPCVFDLDNLICVSLRTHNAIHYGDTNQLATVPIERTPNDTCPWKH